jgi:hypothetical protein
MLRSSLTCLDLGWKRNTHSRCSFAHWIALVLITCLAIDRLSAPRADVEAPGVSHRWMPGIIARNWRKPQRGEIPLLTVAERVGFEPDFRREAKSLENADLVDG